MLKLQNFVNNQFVEPVSGQYFASLNPATAQQNALIPDSFADDVDQAVQAARNAFPAWSQTSRQERSAFLLKIADELENQLEQFALQESQDQGKPIQLARSVDIPRAIYNFRYFAGYALYQHEKKTELDGLALNYTQRMPVGVAGLISPWNLPLYLLTWKIAPCLVFGNTCVCKPSEFTSVTAYMLCQVMQKCGLPAGVVNMIFGYGRTAGQALVSHPYVPLISFTGGTVTGETIAKIASPMHKKLSLELGGKNANIIFEDCDMDKALATTLRSSFNNQGEICLCGSRIFVQESVYKTFVERFIELIKTRVIVGDPADDSLSADGKLHIGALVSELHMNKVLSYVDLAHEEGAIVLHGGNRLVGVRSKTQSNQPMQGFFVEPTVVCTASLDNPQMHFIKPTSSRIMQEEVFGPFVTVTPFNSEQQVIDYANCTKYGLSASVWTENGSRQRRVAEQLHAGTVWVNCWMVRDLNMPFGGFGASGHGREGGEYSRDFFTEMKTICLAK